MMIVILNKSGIFNCVSLDCRKVVVLFCFVSSVVLVYFDMMNSNGRCYGFVRNIGIVVYVIGGVVILIW